MQYVSSSVCRRKLFYYSQKKFYLLTKLFLDHAMHYVEIVFNPYLILLTAYCYLSSYLYFHSFFKFLEIPNFFYS